MRQQLCRQRLGRFSLILAVATVASLAPRTKASTVVIDPFTTGQILQWGPGGGVQGPATISIFTGGVLGGARSMSLQADVFVQQDVSIVIGGGYADYASGSLSDGRASLTYDGAGGGLANLLAGVTQFEIGLDSFNYGSASGKLQFIIFDGEVQETYTTIFNGFTVAPQTIVHSMAGSSIDFSHVQSLKLVIEATGAKGEDLTLVRFVAVIVPEPASWLLAAAGGFIAMALRRRAH